MDNEHRSPPPLLYSQLKRRLSIGDTSKLKIQLRLRSASLLQPRVVMQTSDSYQPSLQPSHRCLPMTIMRRKLEVADHQHYPHLTLIPARYSILKPWILVQYQYHLIDAKCWNHSVYRLPHLATTPNVSSSLALLSLPREISVQ